MTTTLLTERRAKPKHKVIHSGVPRQVQPAWRFLAACALLAVVAFWVFPTHPLYYSNQNHKFLPGLAKAGAGYLAEDWQVQQVSLLPLFDALVYYTARFCGEWGFYVYHWLAFLVFLAALLGIARQDLLVRVADGADYRAALLTLSVVVLVTLTNTGSGRLWDGVAHQYVIGPVFETASFGVLLLLAVWLWWRGRPGWALVAAGVAAWMHPAYAIPGLALIAAAWAADRLAKDNSPRVLSTPEAVVGGLFCLGAAAFTYYLLQPADPKTSVLACRILTVKRIPHHADPSMWFDIDTAAKLLIALYAIWLLGRTRLGWFLGLSLAILAILTLIQVMTSSSQLALAMPWRISVYVVPIAVIVVLTRLVEKITFARHRADSRWMPRAATALLCVLAVTGFIVGSVDKYKTFWSTRPPALYAWVRAHAASGQVYLTPVNMEDFRLATGVPQYVCWKAHPYDAEGVLEWYRRVKTAKALTGENSPDGGLLDATVSEAGVTHLVRPAQACPLESADWARVYLDTSYVVYRRLTR